MKELDELFVLWEKRHSEKGYQRFIKDGIVNEDWWSQKQSIPKICFFLKEARSEEEGYNLVDSLRRYTPWKLWTRVSIWTQAVQYAFSGERKYDDNKIRLKSHEAIKQIAVVNVKKSNGLASSDGDDLWKFVREDKDYLKRELELINADIIICGYTFGMLSEVLGDELEMDGTIDSMYAFWKDKLVIDYYHPACHYPNRVNYYALMSICRMASEEWEERKIRYAYKNDCCDGA